ncbi:DUF2637 domain-containing protein [Streptomyces sp. CWNU-52B]|uniref:DUF2637 domain-containing protein n=1 Tax=unclassified Streptomyces TaxID=2593676 RepID=UPI0039BFB9F6
MNDDYAHLFVPDDRAYDGGAGTGAGTGAGSGRHRGPVDTGHRTGPQEYPGYSGYSGNAGPYTGAPSGSFDSAWDPVEELTYLLQDAASAEPSATVPPPRSEAPPVGGLTGDPMDNLARITAELPRIRSHPSGHRKVRIRKSLKSRFTWLQTVSFTIAALGAVIVSMVSVFGGMVSYVPLRHVASLTESSTAAWWPLLVYGPWMMASLSILRAALHQRRAAHSWFVVLLFASVAMALCAAQAHRTFTSIATAALPALAALACFQQLVRQITLTRPPRQSVPRHRSLPPTAATSTGPDTPTADAPE